MDLSPNSDKLCSQNPQPTIDKNTNLSLDRISNLPNAILYQILEFLPTKQAVGTTILSKKWAHLWTSALTNLEINDVLLHHQENLNRNLNKTLFTRFVDHVLHHADLPCVTRFSLYCFNSYDSSSVNSWLQRGCTQNVKELDIFVSFDKEPIRLTSTVFTSTSLVVLKLSANVKLDIPSNGVCFPSLKVLNMFVYNQKDDVLTRRLYSSCPVLEDLVLGGEMLYEGREMVYEGGEMLYEGREVEFRVVSSSLKRLRINFRLAHRLSHNDYCFKVRAENLVSLDVNDDFLAEYIVVNLLVLDEANVCVGHPSVDYSNRAFRLLGGLLQVKSLSLSGCTTVVLSYAQGAGAGVFDGDGDSDSDSDGDGDGDGDAAANDDNVDDAEDDGNMEDNVNDAEDVGKMEDDDFIVPDEQNYMHSLPTFVSLTHLKFGILKCSSWTLLLHVLEQSPNLESLVLKKEQNAFLVNFSWKPQESIPTCLLYHLKEIKIEGFKGQEPEMILVEFLLENARVLQKMTINSPPLSSVVLREKVLAFPRGSNACQVELC